MASLNQSPDLEVDKPEINQKSSQNEADCGSDIEPEHQFNADDLQYTVLAPLVAKNRRSVRDVFPGDEKGKDGHQYRALINNDWRCFCDYFFALNVTGAPRKNDGSLKQEICSNPLTYFLIYNYIVYGAALVSGRWLISRCALRDCRKNLEDPKEKKEAYRYILMRILLTTCDKPNRAYYVIDTHIKGGANKVCKWNGTFILNYQRNLMLLLIYYMQLLK